MKAKLPLIRRLLSPRVLKILLGFWLLVAVGLALTYMVLHRRALAEWKDYLAAHPETPLDTEPPVRPPIPRGSNFAAIPLFEDPLPSPRQTPLDLPRGCPIAKRLPKGESYDFTGVRDWLIKAGELDSPTDQPAEDILRMLGKFEPYLQQLRDAAPRPDAWFPTLWEDGVAYEMPHHQLIRRAAPLLYWRAHCQLDLGDSAAAMREAQIILRLYLALGSERTSLSIPVRHTFLLHYLQNLAWEGFSGNHWKEPELARLEDLVGKLDLPALFRDIIASNRGNLNWFLEQAYHNPKVLAMALEETGQDSRFYPQSWIRANQLLLNQLLDEQRDSILSSPAEAKTPLWDATQAAQGSFYRRHRDALAIKCYKQMLHVREEHWTAQEFWAQVQVAIALERHRLAHGVFPETLSALPGTLPPDPINGQAFGYRRTEKGYLLWSEGPNPGNPSPGGTLPSSAYGLWEVPGKTKLLPIPKAP